MPSAPLTSLNVMLSASGRRVSLMRHLQQSFDALGAGGRMITATRSGL